jgi:hypothetical protein
MRKLFVILFSLCLVFCGIGSGRTAVWSGNGHDYVLVSFAGKTWVEAQSHVAANYPGYHLATITSAAENNFISSLFPSSPANRDHYWLGGTDAAVENTWTWVTGETWGFIDWWGGEPNDQGGEDYLAFDYRATGSYPPTSTPGWHWNDLSFTNKNFIKGYVAETPVPGAVWILGCLVAGFLGLGRRFRRTD